MNRGVSQPESLGRDHSCSSRTFSTLLHPASPHPAMSLLLLTLLSSLMLREAEAEADAWGAGGKYAVTCPDRCSADSCGDTQHCARTVLDDCGCCQVCAAGRSQHCYRTVSGMNGFKCGAGLFCEFYKHEDDYGDEYGICKDCPYGTYGVECRKTCSCKEGICDRETGACFSPTFFAKITSKLDHNEGLTWDDDKWLHRAQSDSLLQKD